jgi:hypothetical protein
MLPRIVFSCHREHVSPVIETTGVPCRYGSPSGLNAGLSLARPSSVVSARACSSCRNTVTPFRPGTFTGISFGGGCPTLNFEGETILLFPRNIPSGGDIFDRDAHGIDQLRVCKSLT